MRVVIAVLVITGACRSGFDAPLDLGEDAAPQADAPISTELFTVGERDGTDLSGVTVDTTIKDVDPDTNHSGASFLGAWPDVSGVPTEPGLVRFQLSAIAGRVVVAATLTLSIHPDLAMGLEGESVAVHEIAESWIPAEVTYNMRSATEAWASAGAGDDSRGGVIASELVNKASGSFDLALDATAVQSWIDSPDQNFGVALVSSTDGAWLASANYGTDSFRPLLTLELVSLND